MKKRIYLLLTLALTFTVSEASAQVNEDINAIELQESSEVEIDFNCLVKNEVMPVTFDLSAELIYADSFDHTMVWKWEMNGASIGEGKTITAYPTTNDCEIKLTLVNKEGELISSKIKTVQIQKD